jgi:tetratricopeptide (TPR) repeat protein
MDRKCVEASELATKALELWEAGMLSESEAKYREAVALAEETESYQLPDYYSQLAQVLSRAGRIEEATEYHQRAISEALRQGSDNDSSLTGILRYFFAEHLMAIDMPHQTIEILGPSLKGSAHSKNLLRMVEAEALWKLGRKAEAMAAAEDALRLSSTEDQKERIRQRLTTILNNS